MTHYATYLQRRLNRTREAIANYLKPALLAFSFFVTLVMVLGMISVLLGGAILFLNTVARL